MKKLITLGIIFAFFLALIPQAEALSDSKSVPYWKSWVKSYKTGRYERSQRRVPRRIKRDSRRSTSSRGYRYNRLYRDRSSSLYLRSRQSQSQRAELLSININSIKNPVIQTINQDPVPIFEISFSHGRKASPLELPKALLIQKITFDIIDNTGLVSDFSNFQLEINNQKINFAPNGTLGMKLANARISHGENLDLKININIEDPESISHIPGGLRVRLKDIEAVTDSEYKNVRTLLRGNKISHFITWDPVPYTTGGDSTIVGESTKVDRRILMTGEKAFVLSLDLEAFYDDLFIEEITVTDSLSGNAIDTWSYKLRAIDLSNGETLGKSRFLSGKARFRFRPAIFIERKKNRRIGFEIYLNDRINISHQNPQFELDVLPSNLHARGLGSGRELSITDKYFTSDSKDFLVANSKIHVKPLTRQPEYLLSNGRLATVYHFKIQNLGSENTSIGRISANVWLNGVVYPGGISADDFELKLMNNGRVSYGESKFTASIANGTKVIFDTLDEVKIFRNSEQEFALFVALENNDNQTRDDAIHVKLLEDSTFSLGTLSALRSQEQNFIWSDLSARPHSTGTADFLSGYMVSGLPTSSFRLSK